MIHCRPEMDWIVSADRLRIASQNLSTTLFKKGNIECVILAPTTMMRSAKEIKTDRRDAEKIAKCLAFNTYKPVYVPTEEARHHLLQEVFSAWQHLPSSDIIAQEGGRVHAAMASSCRRQTPVCANSVLFPGFLLTSMPSSDTVSLLFALQPNYSTN